MPNKTKNAKASLNCVYPSGRKAWNTTSIMPNNNPMITAPLRFPIPPTTEIAKPFSPGRKPITGFTNPSLKPIRQPENPAKTPPMKNTATITYPDLMPIKSETFLLSETARIQIPKVDFFKRKKIVI